MMQAVTLSKVCVLLVVVLAGACDAAKTVQHVLLISVDGLHSSDLTKWLKLRPDSALADLASRGTIYPNTRDVAPSDSFPGITSLITGGTPAQHGVYYDVSYDRKLSPPGSKCKTKGTVVAFDESIDYDSTMLNGGGGINPKNLPLDPANGCKPVYPHQYSKLNNIFEVVHKSNQTTAWADKHPAYDLVRGPSGTGVSDLYTPEINSVDSSRVIDIIGYDQLHVAAAQNWISGLNDNATTEFKPPALFGLNFQAVSVAQKQQGYHQDGSFTNGLAQAIQFVDQALGNLAASLQANGLADSTVTIVTAKHGQSPILPQLEHKVPYDIEKIISKAFPGEPAAVTSDDIALVWLNKPSDAAKVISKLKSLPEELKRLRVTNVTTGMDQFGSFGAGVKKVALPASTTKKTSSRTPDIVLQVKPGTIFSKKHKIAEHGGDSKDDTAVALLIADPTKPDATINKKLTYITQVAPTILSLLGLDPAHLQIVKAVPDSPTTQVLKK